MMRYRRDSLCGETPQKNNPQISQLVATVRATPRAST